MCSSVVRNHIKIANKSALFASSVGAIFLGSRARPALQTQLGASLAGAASWGLVVKSPSPVRAVTCQECPPTLEGCGENGENWA